MKYKLLQAPVPEPEYTEVAVEENSYSGGLTIKVEGWHILTLTTDGKIMLHSGVPHDLGFSVVGEDDYVEVTHDA